MSNVSKQITTSLLVLTYMLVLFTYALLTHLRYGSGYVWLQTVEDLRDFRFPALTHKPKGSDGRFLDGSEGRSIKMSAFVGNP